MALEPAREQAAWETVRTRKIYPLPLPDGSYQPMILKGRESTALSTGTFADPVQAVEKGVEMVEQGELKAREARHGRIANALARGVYVPWPRETANGLEWVILRASDRSVVSGPYDGHFKCAIEIARLLNEAV